MSIHLRTVTAANGDTLDYIWFCSRSCYAGSFGDEDFDGGEDGGAYPGGSESDSPDFCSGCGDPVGNPLTDEGMANAQDLVNDWHGEPSVRAKLIRRYDLGDVESYDDEAFFRGYVDCALWASTDLDSGASLESSGYGPDDIGDASLTNMRADCFDFVQANIGDLEDHDAGRAGHDFWLTRNRHGAGFWDGDYPDDVGRRLTDASHAYGESNLYVGDDGLVYVTP